MLQPIEPLANVVFPVLLGKTVFLLITHSAKISIAQEERLIRNKTPPFTRKISVVGVGKVGVG